MNIFDKGYKISLLCALITLGGAAYSSSCGPELVGSTASVRSSVGSAHYYKDLKRVYCEGKITHFETKLNENDQISIADAKAICDTGWKNL